jgi:hypothetical protein
MRARALISTRLNCPMRLCRLQGELYIYRVPYTWSGRGSGDDEAPKLFCEIYLFRKTLATPNLDAVFSLCFFFLVFLFLLLQLRFSLSLP